MISKVSPANKRLEELFKKRCSDSADVLRRVACSCSTDVIAAAEMLAVSFHQGRKLLLCGNGGSAADCQHMAAELVSRLTKERLRPALPAIALTTNTSFLTAHANDDHFSGVFARQVEALGKEGDVLLAISTSGQSPNILRAMEEARNRKMCIIALTGPKGIMHKHSDITIRACSDRVSHIQESHLAIEHVLCELIEELLFS